MTEGIGANADYDFKQKSVLIVDDSKTTILALEGHLRKMGFTDIRYTQEGQECIDIFKSIKDPNLHPIVFLDYELTDLNGLSLLSQLLEIDPDGRIVIQSANDQNDEEIKKLINQGAYEFLQKPFHFEQVKRIIQILETEYDIISTDEETKFSQVDNLLKTTSQISLTWLAEYSQLDLEVLLPYIKNLESNGKIIRLNEIKEIGCPQCSSVKTGHSFSCDSCNSSNFLKGKLIEHYDCGNITAESTYQDDMCPKCRKKIKVLGVDYQTWNNFHICLDCNNRFEFPITEYTCLNCNTKFKPSEVNWKTSPAFKIT